MHAIQTEQVKRTANGKTNGKRSSSSSSLLPRQSVRLERHLPANAKEYLSPEKGPFALSMYLLFYVTTSALASGVILRHTHRIINTQKGQKVFSRATLTPWRLTGGVSRDELTTLVAARKKKSVCRLFCRLPFVLPVPSGLRASTRTSSLVDLLSVSLALCLRHLVWQRDLLPLLCIYYSMGLINRSDSVQEQVATLSPILGT